MLIFDLSNRAPPPLPHLHLSQESVNEASTLIHNVINTSLSISEDIALGRDSKAFVRLVLVLVTISVIGSLASFLILTYISKSPSSKKLLNLGVGCLNDGSINLPRCRSCPCSYRSTSLWKIWAPNWWLCWDGLHKNAALIYENTPTTHLLHHS